MAALTRIGTSYREIVVGLGTGIVGLVIGVAATAVVIVDAEVSPGADVAAPATSKDVLPPNGLDEQFRNSLEAADPAGGSSSVLPPTGLNDQFDSDVEVGSSVRDSNSALPPAGLNEQFKRGIEAESGVSGSAGTTSQSAAAPMSDSELFNAEQDFRTANGIGAAEIRRPDMTDEQVFQAEQDFRAANGIAP